MPPFLVFCTTRSGSFWLSHFLSYDGWHCAHDELARMRSLDDVKAWLSQPLTGAVETAAAPFWRMALRMRPDLRVVTLRRPEEEVISSWLKINPLVDQEAMKAIHRKAERKLDQIERRLPNVLSVQFKDLFSEETGKKLFRHCLERDLDRAWLAHMAPLNLQANLPALFRYVKAYASSQEKLRKQARQAEMSALASKPVLGPEGITFQQERFDDAWADAQNLIRDHMVVTNQGVDDHLTKNVPMMRKMDQIGFSQITTARSNGRIFGYVAAIITPSFDSLNKLDAVHLPIFASPHFPGLGLKLLRESTRALEARGISRIFYRAGSRGSGPRLGAAFLRLGAEKNAEIYLKEVEGC